MSQAQIQVQDLSSRYYAFFEGMMTGSHEETLTLFARCEELREKAEASPIPEINPDMSRRILLGSWAQKAHLQAMSFPEGHPEKLEKLQLRDALMSYYELN